ncbi:monofunctional biosynthetic peptidoglycan transglycosylase [Flavobacterium psychrophilum]|uniref:Biosynthetic peptidoglycan transglycosylase n=2 Tax=Flavobacterium psychrophilum TaxID=96345 RepID=A6H228_FLAPJ|nr:monofunctional biosynthetic peptidoglycan transglycosylase [Flavobacterium psychrophilum]AIG31072.1 peptidoglycan transglycosylase [Flavobacterium psychrophilum]AIG33349.1 peptidoglycan transglycosylase [Flavobacterium psychrophilum]AIG35499.1 peptidoglycan transglycosylase [Flavobacterium psychrophilum]AIG37860.1 peptidoglycan transglycosylase [Flavobacterium psychrophilum]AIG40131.1 peptidoglycan transglycosylase [Flavobacterium psychrophilum]
MATKKVVKPKLKPTPKKGNTSFGSKIKSFIFKCILWFVGLSVFWVIIFRFVPIFYTPLMIFRAFEHHEAGKEMVCSHQWVPLEDISLNLPKAVIASEDGLFLKHNGFDFSAMSKAFSGNLKGKKLKGGSTISQQTAKNVFLWQGRSYLRKGLEAYFTVLIELIWGKERIMEVYLNSIEMGDGVYGAEAASKHWFHKSAKNLTKYEAASIASILPNPRKYKATNSSAYVEKRKNKTLRVMKSVGKIEY